MIDLIFLFSLSMSGATAGDILENDINVLELQLEKLNEKFKDAVYFWQQERNEGDKSWKNWQQYKKELNKMAKDDERWNTLYNMVVDEKAVWRELGKSVDKLFLIKDEIQEEINDLQLIIDLKNEDLIKLRAIEEPKIRYKNVGLVLSGNCIGMIDRGADTKCPTYQQLFSNFDNTFPIISGEFEETTYDIKRKKSQMTNHWKFYESSPNWIIIMVDPDVEFMNRNHTITVQANSFETFSIYGDYKTKPFDGTITTYEGVWFDGECKETIVAPDLVLISHVISYVSKNCEGDFEIDPKIINIPNDYEPDTSESPWTKYKEWLKTVKDKYRSYMIGRE